MAGHSNALFSAKVQMAGQLKIKKHWKEHCSTLPCIAARQDESACCKEGGVSSDELLGLRINTQIRKLTEAIAYIYLGHTWGIPTPSYQGTFHASTPLEVGCRPPPAEAIRSKTQMGDLKVPNVLVKFRTKGTTCAPPNRQVHRKCCSTNLKQSFNNLPHFRIF